MGRSGALHPVALATSPVISSDVSSKYVRGWPHITRAGQFIYSPAPCQQEAPQGPWLLVLHAGSPPLILHSHSNASSPGRHSAVRVGGSCLPPPPLSLSPAPMTPMPCAPEISYCAAQAAHTVERTGPYCAHAYEAPGKGCHGMGGALLWHGLGEPVPLMVSAFP